MKDNIIVDLDGTLSQDDERRILIPEKGFKAYFEALNGDTCNEAVKAIMAIMANNSFKVHILTARPDLYEIQTRKWLSNHNVFFDRLLMRPEGTYNPNAIGSFDAKDWTPDGEVKDKMLADADLHPDNVLFCLDDKDSMLVWWRERGFDAWQVREQGTLY